MNVNEKIVTGATIGGSPGSHRGDNPYYAFDLGRRIDPNEEVIKHAAMVWNLSRSRLLKTNPMLQARTLLNLKPLSLILGQVQLQ